MPLPFEMPHVSRGYARLTRGACRVGALAAAEAARALGALTGGEVSVAGRALPAVSAPAAWGARLWIELAALPGAAAVEVEPRLAVALLDRLCGGPGASEAATVATPMEVAALELAALSAVEAIGSIREIDERLAPRLARRGLEVGRVLAIDLAITMGCTSGRARLLLPDSAIEPFGDGLELPGPVATVTLELSLRGGSAPLLPEELEDLAAGDVVLLDPPSAGRLAAVAPGGLRVLGTEQENSLHVEEIQMPEACSEYPVALEVELARVPLTLGELARLEPGAVIPLPIDRHGHVALKLGERTVARGQLVDVEGTVGVRIDSLVGGP